MGKSALRLFHISTTCLCFQTLLEFRDGGPEGRVSSDAIVVTFDIVECDGSCFIHRAKDLHIDLGLEAREKAFGLGVVIAVALK